MKNWLKYDDKVLLPKLGSIRLKFLAIILLISSFSTHAIRVSEVNPVTLSTHRDNFMRGCMNGMRRYLLERGGKNLTNNLLESECDRQLKYYGLGENLEKKFLEVKGCTTAIGAVIISLNGKKKLDELLASNEIEPIIKRVCLP